MYKYFAKYYTNIKNILYNVFIYKNKQIITVEMYNLDDFSMQNDDPCSQN